MGLENAVTEEYGLANWGMKVVGLEGLAGTDRPDIHQQQTLGRVAKNTMAKPPGMP
jgi:hypothetical protein